ncbi:MAG: hypothetical protein JWR16_1151 [Nevskia sp.]|nr:hypothetical protein [Nevskia sp.]
MRRRDVVLGLGAGGLVACAAPPRLTLGQRTSAEVRLNAMPRGPALRSSFLGLSFESSLLTDASVFSVDNLALIALLRRLTPDGVLRIGGNSSEFGVWQRQPTALATPFEHAVMPADIDRLKGFVDACGWRVIYGLNLGHGEPERAADEAAYLVQRLGARLEALQIGNEPDLYYRNGLRPKDYNVGAYIAEWRRYAQAIRAQTPAAPLAGPDVAYRPEWIEAFTQACGNEVLFVSDHYYAGGPANDPDIGIATLFLSEREHYQRLRAVAQRNAQAGKPLRITESNSIYNGGKPNVSDTFGAALWAAQLLFQSCRDGITGINFHGGNSGPYTPIARDAKTGAWTPQPLYYAMLLFAQATPATLIDAATQTGNTLLRTHGLIGDDGKLKLVLINESAALAIDLRVSAEQAFRRASALRLSASSMWSLSGITLGGSLVDSRAGWQPQPEKLAIDGGAAYLTLSPASAMLVSFD